jgi:hypothetical protein
MARWWILLIPALISGQPMSIGGGAAQLSNVMVQYSTDGVVKLNIMNVTFVTKELRVVLLGCDLGYFDNYLLFPPTPSWQTQVTPFSCLECNCEVFESLRTESFVAVNA